MPTKSIAQPRPKLTIPPKGIGPVDKPNENDVLCGRGGRINAHAGNVQFREIVNSWKMEYLAPSTKKLEKAFIAARLVSDIRMMDPPGRFLKPESDSFWYDIGDAKAIKKAGQALREEAPEIRQEFESCDRQEESERQSPTKPAETTSSDNHSQRKARNQLHTSGQGPENTQSLWNPAAELAALRQVLVVTPSGKENDATATMQSRNQHFVSGRGRLPTQFAKNALQSKEIRTHRQQKPWDSIAQDNLSAAGLLAMKHEYDERQQLQLSEPRQNCFLVQGTINLPRSHAGVSHALFQFAAAFAGIFPEGLNPDTTFSTREGEEDRRLHNFSVAFRQEPSAQQFIESLANYVKLNEGLIFFCDDEGNAIKNRSRVQILECHPTGFSPIMEAHYTVPNEEKHPRKDVPVIEKRFDSGTAAKRQKLSHHCVDSNCKPQATASRHHCHRFD